MLNLLETSTNTQTKKQKQYATHLQYQRHLKKEMAHPIAYSSRFGFPINTVLLSKSCATTAAVYGGI